MPNLVETTRHNSVFNAVMFANKRIDIVGCGATGSQIAMLLAKLGVADLHLWDFDKIEAHNIANQIFGLPDIGRPKVEALADMIRTQTGLEPSVHNERVTGKTTLGNVVFLLTDTMASRKEIWDGAIRMRSDIDRMIETRMGSSEGRIYSISPFELSEVKYWESTLCDDEVATDSLCGTRVSVGPTAILVAGYAVWAFMRWFEWSNCVDGKIEEPEVEMLFFAKDGLITTNRLNLIEAAIASF